MYIFMQMFILISGTFSEINDVADKLDPQFSMTIIWGKYMAYVQVFTVL